MDFQSQAIELMQKIGDGYMLSTPYETAWAARLVELNEPLGEAAMNWLRKHQLEDGSWGAKDTAYFYDRLICTLAGAIIFAKYGNDSVQDRQHLAHAKTALQSTIKDLAEEATIETIGFEMIAPTLLREAQQLNIIGNLSYLDIDLLQHQREAKLNKLPNGLINRNITIAFSAEMAGIDGIRLIDGDNVQETNGSLGHSPAATAYFALNVYRGDEKALNYLRSLDSVDGGVPGVFPTDIFERSWVLWNFALLQDIDDKLVELAQPHLDFLEKAWTPGEGTSYAIDCTLKDGDDTSVVFETLLHYGREADVETILTYEERDHFRCFPIESNPSVSANVHALGALRKAGLASDHPSVQKIVRFLQITAYWYDKWHVSPYYVTSHAIISAVGYLDDLVIDAVEWIITTQNENGSWGYYHPTAEETAYCLQALVIWQRNGYPVRNSVLEKGRDWLVEHMEPPYPPLWINKCLYAPQYVIESSVLSALMLVGEALEKPVSIG